MCTTCTSPCSCKSPRCLCRPRRSCRWTATAPRRWTLLHTGRPARGPAAGVYLAQPSVSFLRWWSWGGGVSGLVEVSTEDRLLIARRRCRGIAATFVLAHLSFSWIILRSTRSRSTFASRSTSAGSCSGCERRIQGRRIAQNMQPMISMDAFDREARVYSPVWSPSSDDDLPPKAAVEPVGAEVDLSTMQWCARSLSLSELSLSAPKFALIIAAAAACLPTRPQLCGCAGRALLADGAQVTADRGC